MWSTFSFRLLIFCLCLGANYGVTLPVFQAPFLTSALSSLSNTLSNMDTDDNDDYEVMWTPTSTDIETINYDDQKLAKQVYDLLSEDKVTVQPSPQKPTELPASLDVTQTHFSAFPRFTSPRYLAPRPTIGLNQYAFRPSFNGFVHPRRTNEISSAALSTDYVPQPLPGQYLTHDSPHPLWYPRRIPLVRHRRFGGYPLHRPYTPLYPHRWNHPWRWPMHRRRHMYPYEEPFFVSPLVHPPVFEDFEKPMHLEPKTDMVSPASGEMDENIGKMTDFSSYED